MLNPHKEIYMILLLLYLGHSSWEKTLSLIDRDNLCCFANKIFFMDSL